MVQYPDRIMHNSVISATHRQIQISRISFKYMTIIAWSGVSNAVTEEVTGIFKLGLIRFSQRLWKDFEHCF